jgi:hypothetical protein
MSTRLKLTDSIVLNADEIIDISQVGASIEFFTTETSFNVGDPQNYFSLVCESSNEASALEAAIKKALTSAPSGRVIKVPSSSDYTINAATGLRFFTDF